MKVLYVDASFDWSSTEKTEESVVRGKIAVCGEGLNIVERVAVGKVKGLKQYINILELVAIARAVEIAKERRWEGELSVITDSKVAMYWARAYKINPKVLTSAHVEAMRYLKRVVWEWGQQVEFDHVKREYNPAGVLLADELEREAPHSV